MKANNTVTLLFAVLIGTIFTKTSAQELIITKADGTENISMLSDLQKLAFTDNELNIFFTTELTELFSLSSIRTIKFGNVPVTGLESNEIAGSQAAISLYPNPAGDFLYFTNLPTGPSTIRIYRIDGVLFLNTEDYQADGPLYIGQLEQGLYLVKVNNSVLKIQKL
ncbi:MAG: T9SS type A sorting domain-containing protein [Bacteroidales bacterium]|nr:T9SS type A sorting domain-containing protein [Bacteroidales bacterium]